MSSQLRGIVTEVWPPHWLIVKPRREKAHTRATYVVLETRQEGPNIFVFGPADLEECRRYCRIHQGILNALAQQRHS